MPIVDRSAERIADLERQLAAIKKTLSGMDENFVMMTPLQLAKVAVSVIDHRVNQMLLSQVEIGRLRAEIEVMRPVVELAKKVGNLNQFPGLDAALQDYEARKPK